MNLTRHEPWSLLGPFGPLFAPPRRRTRTAAASTAGTWIPAADIKEEPDRFVIHADIPGVDPKDIEVRMENGILSIKGQRPSETEENRTGYRRIERVRGSFQRRFSLPDTADAAGISATSQHGVLEVVIPKQNKAQPRRIEVTG